MNDLGIHLFVAAVQVALLGLIAAVIIVFVGRHHPRNAAHIALLSLALSTLVWLNAFGVFAPLQSLKFAPRPSTHVEAIASMPDGATAIQPTPMTERRPRFQFNLDFLPGPTSANAAESPRRYWNIFAAVIGGVFAIAALQFACACYALRRLRRSSRRIEDSDLNLLCDEIRAAMGCPYKIEVRSSRAITCAATIGWRHPVVLLAENWREWPSEDLKAALAHEIAHVCNGDFVAAVLAKLCVMVQCYHPAAVWLSRRLRAEQELAADALAADRHGSRASYLESLARIALREDQATAPMLAHSFFKDGSTLLRRIAMLKKPEGRTPPTWSVWTIRAALFVMAVLVTVVKGSAETSATSVPAGALAPLDLRFVPKDSMLFIAVRPAAMAQHEGMAKWIERLEFSFNTSSEEHDPAFVMPLREIDQVIFYGEFEYSLTVGAPSGKRHFSDDRIAMIRMTKDYDWAARLKAMSANVPMKELKPNYYYVPYREGRRPYHVRVVDSRTITFVPEERISSTPAQERWGCAADPLASAAVVIGIDNRDTTFGRFLARDEYKSVEGLEQLFDTAKHATLTIENAPTTGGMLLIDCWDPYMATADCDRAIRAIGDFARKRCQETLARKDKPEPQIAYWCDFAKHVLKRDEFKIEGSNVRLVSRTRIPFAQVFQNSLPPIFLDDKAFEEAQADYKRENEERAKAKAK